MNSAGDEADTFQQPRRRKSPDSDNIIGKDRERYGKMIGGKNVTTEARMDYIDGLRAIAIGLVVVFHTGLHNVPNGYLGVDVFFVISGFLISGQIFDSVSSGSFSMTDFYARRIVRIGPPVLLVIASVLTAACLLPILTVDMKRIALSAIFSAAMASNWYFWADADYFAPGAEREPLLHLWSLGVEEQYYLIAPAMALMLAALAWRMRLDVSLLWLSASILVVVGSFAAAIELMASKPDLVFFATPLRGWEFAAGAVAVLLLRYGLILSQSLARVGALAGLAAIGVASAAFVNKPEYRVLLQLCAAAGACSVLLCGAFAKGGVACRLLAARPMVGLGLISYSLYLWHWPVPVFVRLTQLDKLTPLQIILAGVIVPILLAVLTYRAVESPLRRWRQGRGWVTNRSRAIAHGLGASVLVGAAGVAVLIAAVQLARMDPFRALEEATAYPMKKCPPGAQDEGPSIECRLGRGSDARVLLWGDSHALVVAPAVESSATEFGRSAHLQWVAECSPLAGNTIYLGGFPWAYCMRRNELVMHWLVAPEMQSVTGIILSGAWQHNYGGQAITPDWAVAAAKLGEAMVRTLGELHGMGLRVLVLGPVPTMPYPVPECIFRARSETELRRCRYTRNEVDLMQHDVINALQSAVSQFDRARFVDFKAALCDSDFCWPSKNGKIFYGDTNHLSGSGARVVYDRFKDEFAWTFGAKERDQPSAASR
jgi:peptidoglycan/LPS O-acetylase OafA/YrhL